MEGSNPSGLLFFRSFYMAYNEERREMSAQPEIDNDYVDYDSWAEGWLDRNYGGGPDECSQCYREGKIVKIKECTIHN